MGETLNARRKRGRSSITQNANEQLNRMQKPRIVQHRHDSFKDRYHLLETIGEGTYGVVYKAVDIASGRVVALKKIRTNNPDEGLPATSIREIKLLKTLDHPNIICLRGVFHESGGGRKSGPMLLLEFDYLECDLRKFTKRFPKRRLPLPVVRLVMQQILSALNYCHERQIIHRDMKPSNVLVHFQAARPSVYHKSIKNRVQAESTAHYVLEQIEKGMEGEDVNVETVQLLLNTLCVKLADFGLARLFPAPVRPLTHEVVTLWYRAPEIVLGFEHYTTAIDIWSVGCIFLELLYGRPVFCGDSEMETLYKTFQLLGTPTPLEWPEIKQLPCYQPQWPSWRKRIDRYDYLRPELDSDAKNLLDRLLAFSPEARCTAAEALAHPWFMKDSPVSRSGKRRVHQPTAEL
eukprot:Gregarina_sp_Poly_1__3522@NODE_2027_length_2834_cov_135_403325_g1310_i0_p1_GENE_NODE_2027_length_2834_cov_135_403325_g1310_i0NODE_2027_length_2834_cov_135_403325_g1310_i0_p1_ORF_typecomplete_len405_score38_54Pkinase/PF00069_25/1_2e67Pkinase_Tyr/PF07714_17/5_3e36Kinaselike/PF14531_6/0_0018Kinaselike/PF14531_6/0_026Kdo/PF06293_14/2e07Haspin_kinase/PF12330_8/0_00051Pkinase_fungal/PF17667_1/9_9e06FTA2/PF13095_6/0_29FTA2/PF13095_6/1_5APH/PF01636_23/0_056APH/PF01636_23/1_7e03WaaY/PF06176_11/0_12YrbLPh